MAGDCHAWIFGSVAVRLPQGGRLYVLLYLTPQYSVSLSFILLLACMLMGPIISMRMRVDFISKPDEDGAWYVERANGKPVRASEGSTYSYYAFFRPESH